MGEGMLYQKIPGVARPLSRVVYGTSTKPLMAGEDRFDLLDAAFEAGVNVFDSAAAYGQAEAVLGRWLKARGLRDRVSILTKGANPGPNGPRVTEEDICFDVEQSLARLQTDFIEIYILHRDDPSRPVGPMVEALNTLHRQGKIGVFGGSNWTLERTREANAYAAAHGLVPFTVCSPSYSLAECIGDPWGGSVTISGPQNAGYRAWLGQQQIPVFAYSSLARGFLSGRLKSDEADPATGKALLGPAWEEYGYPVNLRRLARAERLAARRGTTVPQVAFAWLLRQPLDIFGITSPGSPAHLAQTVQALHLPLAPGELAWLNLETDLEPGAEG